MTTLSSLLGSTFKGNTGTLTVGTTTVVVPSTSPSVSNVGIPTEADLRFSLPRSPVLSVGTTTTVNSTIAASVTPTTTNGDVSLAFSIPRGNLTTIGTTTTVNSTVAASVTPTTTNGDISLAFAIPRGNTTAIHGTPVIVVNPNVNPSIDVTTSSGDLTLQYSLPRASAISVGTVTTGAAGSSATVTNVGTGGDTVLNFTIPKGDTGAVSATSTDTFSNKTISSVDNTIKANETLTLAISDETTAITTGINKMKFRAPFAMTLYQIPRASLSTASTSGIPTIDINDGGVSILSTKLTIDANEVTSTTAATAAVLSDTSIADDAEITFDIDVAGTGAKGLKVTLYYRRT